jgi:hypothetical protein
MNAPLAIVLVTILVGHLEGYQGFQVIVETEGKDHVAMVTGEISGGYLSQVATWQIVNDNGTGLCEITRTTFSCPLTFDELMPVELTILYTPTRPAHYCGGPIVTLDVDIDGRQYQQTAGPFLPHRHCVHLPTVRS